MPELTSTFFGLVIAFFLPGLTLIFGFTSWMKSTDKGVLLTFCSTNNSSYSTLFLLISFAVTAGLLLAGLRWALFEELILRKYKLQKDDFKNIDKDNRLAAFRATVDETYRYHQFWGNMVFAVLPFLLSIVCQDFHNMEIRVITFKIALVVLVEALFMVISPHLAPN
jgi:hypothetical protein